MSNYFVTSSCGTVASPYPSHGYIIATEGLCPHGHKCYRERYYVADNSQAPYVFNPSISSTPPAKHYHIKYGAKWFDCTGNTICKVGSYPNNF
jgi:hypothetical protein